MLTVALTGGIGSGKTEATKLFSALGPPIIDTDIISRDLVEPGKLAYQEIVEYFGTNILLPDNTLNRQKLRTLIFDSPQDKLKLESILHPKIRQAVKDHLAIQNYPYAIIVIPLLIETGQTDLADRILVIDTNPEMQLARVVQRDQSDKALVEKILAAQVTREERLSVATDVIENTGSIDLIRSQVQKLHEKYLAIGNNTHTA